MWNTYRSNYEADISMGLFQVFTHTMGMDLKSPMLSLPQPMGPSKPQGEGKAWYKKCLPSFVQQLDDNSSAILGHVFLDGNYHFFSNDRFESLFMKHDEVEHRLRHMKVAPLLTWPR